MSDRLTRDDLLDLIGLAFEAHAGDWERARPGTGEDEQLKPDPDGLAIMGTVATIADCTHAPCLAEIDSREKSAAYIVAACNHAPRIASEVIDLRAEVDQLQRHEREHACELGMVGGRVAGLRVALEAAGVAISAIRDLGVANAYDDDSHEWKRLDDLHDNAKSAINDSLAGEAPK